MAPCLIRWVNQALLLVHAISTAAMIATLVLVVSGHHGAAYAVLAALWGAIAVLAVFFTWQDSCTCHDKEVTSEVPLVGMQTGPLVGMQVLSPR